MKERIMRRLLIAALLLATPAIAQVPPTLQPNTVLGRLGATPGPAQQIPFTTLSSQLSIGATPPGGPPGSVQFNSAGVFGGISLSANSLIGALAPNTPTLITINNCNTPGSSALTWTSGTGFGCNTITGGGGGGAVVSVFGRTGAVTATSGDYSFSLLSGTATAIQLPITGTGGTPNKVASIGTATTITGGNCAQWDANLNLVSTGTACTSGGLSAISSDNVLANVTNASAVPVGVTLPVCTAGQALFYGGGAFPHSFSCVSTSGTASAAGANTQVQFNNSGAFGASANLTWISPVLTIGAAGVTGQTQYMGSTSGSISVQAPAVAGSNTLTWPAATDTIIGKATTDTLTNKTYDTAGTGNVFKINGTTVNAVTGTGSVVLATSPTLVTPTLGVATATSINKLAITTPATAATLAIADGKTLTQNTTLTYSGTDGSSVNFGAGGTVSYTVATGTVALGTGAIGSGFCASAVTVSTAGILTTDVVMASFNGDPTGVLGYQPSTSGMLTIIPYPTAGAANFKVCNNTAASITPGAITLNYRVTR
jgi:hypothetical protein